MMSPPRHAILGVKVHATSYDDALARILAAARAQRPFAVTALAVHGVMTGALDAVHRFRLNRFDLVCPDGQPVRWALNLLYRARLADRVYGPELMGKICAAAAAEGLPVYLYGSRPVVLEQLCDRLRKRFPGLLIAGSRPSLFRRGTPEEKVEINAAIRGSGARIVLVGLGCPRQEIWTYENAESLSLPTIAVGAAFDFHAGTLRQAPASLQRAGLEWAFRLWAEPRRLWRRYVLLNPAFLALLAAQSLRLKHFDVDGEAPTIDEHFA